jgi:ABC-2 type transport system permease protein
MTALRNVGYLVQKELRQYFSSPIAYVALAFWSFGVGFFFIWNLGEFLQRSSMMPEMSPGMYKPSINDWVIAGSIYNMAVVGLFITPMITMRLLAEEMRHGTIELLATSPITDLEIVLGKFFGALSLYSVMILTGFANFVLLWVYAEKGATPDWRPLVTGALGLLLLGALFIAVGLFLSSLTRNQIVAGTVTFFVLLTLWLLALVDSLGSGPIAQAIGYLGVTDHLRDLVRGIVDLKDVVFYLSFIFFGLFLAHQSMESHRWRA